MGVDTGEEGPGGGIRGEEGGDIIGIGVGGGEVLGRRVGVAVAGVWASAWLFAERGALTAVCALTPATCFLQRHDRPTRVPPYDLMSWSTAPLVSRHQPRQSAKSKKSR